MSGTVLGTRYTGGREPSWALLSETEQQRPSEGDIITPRHTAREHRAGPETQEL